MSSPRATERTPLLSTPEPDNTDGSSRPTPTTTPNAIVSSSSLLSPFRRLLLAALLQALSFVATATPIIFAFRIMSCEIYYERNPPYQGTGDRCARKEIDSTTASAISLMVTLTTFSGLLNLFTTSWIIRRRGVKLAMTLQTLVPCVRNVCQIYAMFHGGLLGIQIIQWTQLLTIFGGGGGYMLTANSYAAALVTPEERTASFGILQGFLMLGTALGYTLGGLVDDMFGAPAPFEMTLGLLIFSTLLSVFFLPYIPPNAQSPKTNVEGVLAPLKIFWPRYVEVEGTGRSVQYWGMTWLAIGSFLGVFATAFVPLALQLMATNMFGFGPKKNGYLLSLTAVSRASFLTFAFPRAIARGRIWLSRPQVEVKGSSPTARATPPRPPTQIKDLEPLSLNPDELTEPAPLPKPTDQVHGSLFDLFFLRMSMLVDACLTACVTFTTQGWHVYLGEFKLTLGCSMYLTAALILPLASGTAPAAKGVIMELVEPSQQSLALQAIALVESLAMVSTVSVLGIAFAMLSEVGKGLLIFVVNGAIAMVAAGVLMLVKFPPGSKGRVGALA
ncbi:BQ2448_6910 [Microbotryum intermedium]|uniref:BQ2448_6910 protein n=1 Tax=Microbotryum intermedium TaxID=269621 RepID=A0A238FIJ0_9BASI|nr:BQ2448_6910 [Microbotryum intermedium]